VAGHNLQVVELKLAKLHAQLAQRLLNEAEKKSLQQTIEKLQAALDHQRTARELDPQNEQYKQDARKTEQQLAQKMTEKGAQEEARADKTLDNPDPQSWETKQAEEHLKTALADFQEAKALDAQNQEAPRAKSALRKNWPTFSTKKDATSSSKPKKRLRGIPTRLSIITNRPWTNSRKRSL